MVLTGAAFTSHQGEQLRNTLVAAGDPGAGDLGVAQMHVLILVLYGALAPIG